MAAHCNLVTRHANFDYLIRAPAQIPSESTGLLFPFVPELANPDYSTPLRVIDRFLKYCLGDSAEEVREAFDRLRSSWGVLALTSYGSQLAHMYWCLGLALESGGTVRVISSSSDSYNGCMVLGKFSITVRDVTYNCASRETLVADFGKASPHDTALSSIFGKIFFKDDDERTDKKDECTSIHDIRKILEIKGTSEVGREEIRRLSYFLSFDENNSPLSFTAHNVSRILEAIDNAELDETSFPLYPPALLFTDRKARLWSAFGAMAPSFRVPGGKKMSLEDTFQVTERSKGGEKTTRSVKKIGFVLKPLKESLDDLNALITDKTIFNPHGASIMSRASSGALVKTFEGDQCDKVVVGLRKIAKVTISEASGSGKNKRKPEMDIDEEMNRKKARADDL
jgi:hypothetical protein